MKGKKKDFDFLSNFIRSCVENDKTSSCDILNEAKMQIKNIDDKIKEVEELKILRGKLLDVVYTFEKEKSNLKKSENYDYLSLSNKNICNYICSSINNKVTDINDICTNEYDKQTIIDCIKQLLAKQIIIKDKEILLKGTNFNKYYNIFICGDN